MGGVCGVLAAVQLVGESPPAGGRGRNAACSHARTAEKRKSRYIRVLPVRVERKIAEVYAGASRTRTR